MATIGQTIFTLCYLPSGNAEVVSVDDPMYYPDVNVYNLLETLTGSYKQ